jgi:anti-sigma factor RsiW
MNDNHLSPEALYAYEDSLLPALERRAAERHLAACAECQARLAGSVAIVHALKEQLGSTRAPQSLRTAIRVQIQDGNTRRTIIPSPTIRVLALASIALVVLLALGVIVAGSLGVGAPRLVAQLTEAHRQLAQEPERIQVEGDAVGFSTWLEQQVHERVDLPTPDGFSRVGGREENVNGQLAAHILYRQADGATMSVFIWRGTIATTNLAPREVAGDQFYLGTQFAETVVLWPERDLAYACVGQVPPEGLLDLAARVRRSDND